MKVYMASTYGLKKYPELMEKCDYFLESFVTIQSWQMPFFKKAKGFLLDSGAFTFMNSGKNKDLKKYAYEYAHFVKDNDIRRFFELDVESVVGWDEYQRLNDIINNITQRQSIPVFHKSRGISWFESACKQVDYIAFGGVAVKNGGSKKAVKDVMPIFIDIAHKHNTMIHGLGFTATADLKRIRFDSVDSTTWKGGRLYGQISQFTGNGIVLFKPEKNGKKLRAKSNIDEHNFLEWIKYQRYAEENL